MCADHADYLRVAVMSHAILLTSLNQRCAIFRLVEVVPYCQTLTSTTTNPLSASRGGCRHVGATARVC